MEVLILWSKGKKELNFNQHDPDGVMMGRAAYTDPFLLTNVDHVFYEREKKGLF
jgi:hypothetical protein